MLAHGLLETEVGHSLLRDKTFSLPIIWNVSINYKYILIEISLYVLVFIVFETL